MTKPSLAMELQKFAEEIAEEVEEVETEEVDDFNFDEPEEEQEPEQEPEQEKTEEQKRFEFELQYNKEKIVIDDETKLRELAQKGMNYDKVLTKAQELENDAMRKWGYEYMKEVGYDNPDDFLSAIKRQKEEEAVEARVQEYLNRGYGEDVAREMAEIKKENETIKSQFENMTKKTREQQEYETFLAWHTQQEESKILDKLDPNSIPQSVWDEFAKGKPLQLAYMEHMLPDIVAKAEQRGIQKIAKNAETSTGALEDGGVSDEGTWTTDYIERMASSKGQSWVKQNYDRIEKSGYFN